MLNVASSKVCYMDSKYEHYLLVYLMQSNNGLKKF